MLCTLGLFLSKEAAAKTMKLMPRISLGAAKAMVAGPLKDFLLAPDVIVVESVPEHAMWLSLAANFKEGGRLNFNSLIFQAECVDVTVVPYLTGELNMTPGCYGCRQATDTRQNICSLESQQNCYPKSLNRWRLCPKKQ